MNFVVGLLRTYKKNDSIWVIGDRLTKFSHSILVKSTYKTEDYERMYINEIVNLIEFLCPSFRTEVPNSLLSTAFHP